MHNLLCCCPLSTVHCPLFLAVAQINHLWYALPLIVVVALVYAATRHERPGAIFTRGIGCGLTIAGFMALILLLLALISRMT